MKNTLLATATLALSALLYSAIGSQAQTAKPAPPEFRMTYTLTDGSAEWDAEKRRRIIEAMDGAVTLYNQMGEFDKKARVSYNVGTPTADGNYNGSIRFGGQIGKRTALHELGHVLGVGTHPKWQSFIKEGKWTGTYALAQLRAFDGPDAVLHADRQHFWPYGLNFDKESSPENDRRHVLMVAAFRRDLQIINGQRGDAP
ncbi:MAG: hypothetical protein V4671_01795 [Armatimonadota bacterium]